MSALDKTIFSPFVMAALAEDLGRRGDVTSQATIASNQTATLHLRAREAGILCGLPMAQLAFEQLDNQVHFQSHCHDGQVLRVGQTIATVSGNAYALLAAERTALNFLTHLSGVATTTHDIVQRIAHTQAKVTCTRKTIPGMRILQKYAVRMGGGRNHRMGLDDAILIKDNHIALSGKNLVETVNQALDFAGHLLPVEVEVDTLAQLEAVLKTPVSLVLLDNMDVATLKIAVSMCQGQCKTEASGGLRPETAVAVAKTGVDFLAMGYLTHSPKYLDIGLDFVE